MTALQVLQLTDLHLAATPAATVFGIDTHARFLAALKQGLQQPTDLVLLTGDLAETPSQALYQTLITQLEAHWKGPWLWTPGNHDVAALMTAALLALGRAPVQHACYRHGEWAIQMLDTHVDDTPAGAISAASLAALAEDLAAERARHVLLAGHHPLLPVGTPWLDSQVPPQGAALAARLAVQPQVRAYLCGHVHQVHRQPLAPRAAAFQASAPATSVAYIPGSTHFSYDIGSCGYQRLQLQPDGSVQLQPVQFALAG